MNEFLCENLKKVEDNIAAACQKAGRDRSEVTLIAVSKTKPVDMLQTVYDQNIREFGENKVKYIVGKTALIHSVDSLHLAKEIEKQAAKNNVIVPILIEVNIAEEESKFGIHKEETIALVREVAQMQHVHIRGLMTIAPYVENPEDNRPYFKGIRQLSVDIKQENIDNVDMDVLSMGMTGDYMVAIEEGATLVRVGTGIFGERQYHI
ncbi:MAG: YggS family pyridoxal phosphate enzyme [Roseburia sp. CAG:197_41_10]|nr:MAG: YggS family pyridoxal phosphate enzyme [Roseburia sp. CAG:197_41_10]